MSRFPEGSDNGVAPHSLSLPGGRSLNEGGGGAAKTGRCGRVGRSENQNIMALNAAGNDEAEWEPPSEAELKVIQARRERQDKISKLMSDYLLKGYRMLGDCCEECGTILLQDKQKKFYCVACQELNSDVDKDNPALNAQAALSQVRERQLASSAEDNTSPESLSSLPTPRHVPRPEHCEGAASGLRASAPAPVLALPVAVPAPVPTSPPPVSALAAAEEALLQKISWAGRELQQSTSIEMSIQLCSLIHSCTESLKGIKELLQ